ncbi:MAG TPA: enoyl-CoA hydratase/isomerase family protein [Opitutaceae bacterium]|nr:enoyl-CoA hydratase/isomerase family protein [Opitutaceae bacterium]
MAAPLFLLADKKSSITTLTLNRPDKRNALNVELLQELCDAVSVAEQDPSQRILILRGAGSVFCAGLDLNEATNLDRAHGSAELVSQALRRLSETRLVTIASVHGVALAGGAGLMCACDFAVATRDAKFGYPEVHRGLVPGLIMTFLRRQLRERDVRELLLLGKLFDAERALALGLINRVVEDEASLAWEIQGITSSLLQGAPDALSNTKKLLAELWHTPVSADLNRALAFHLTARNSNEASEGIAAFLEKRAPAWAEKK